MADNKFEVLEKEFPETLILQMAGNFYNAYNSGAFVLNGLADYKVNEKTTGIYKAGFPINALDKVIGLCNQYHVNFRVYNGNELIEHFEFDDNSFSSFAASYKHNPAERKENNKNDIDNRAKEGVRNNVKEDNKQSSAVVTGCGLTQYDAILDINSKLQNNVYKNGFRIVSMALLESVNDKNLVTIQGLVIYE